ncbi:CST complex subunit Ten1 [Tricladium varicosporioides]|nr:CST complex subunit Ten1 [Hymenoscyphus varicosporioides]
MAGIQNGPIPSTLSLLSDLHQHPPGTKVRFLGCVTEYSIKSASLILEHNYPRDKAFKARVNVDLLLENLKAEETQIGEWVNVIGYIGIDQSPLSSHEKNAYIPIQAIVLWPTGPFNLQTYERSLRFQS